MQIKKDMWYWHELLELCDKYKRIYVSGPQRSGTKFTTYTLAKYELKEYFPVYSGKFKGNLQRKDIRQRFETDMTKETVDPLIIQCPHETHRLHTIEDVLRWDYKNPQPKKDIPDNCLVIWMDRNPEDVMKSEDRIGWHEKCFVNEEIPKYVDMFSEYEDTIKKFKRNWYMKTWVWNNIQKDLMKVDYLELPYETLVQAAGYVPKEQRVGFTKNQVSKSGELR